MKKVKQVWYKAPTEESRRENSCSTGLILELEDGTMLAHASTDIVMPFEPLNPKP